MESNKKEFQGDAAQSSGPRSAGVPSRDATGFAAPPIAIAPPHGPYKYAIHVNVCFICGHEDVIRERVYGATETVRSFTTTACTDHFL